MAAVASARRSGRIKNAAEAAEEEAIKNGRVPNKPGARKLDERYFLESGETIEQFIARIPSKPDRERMRKGAFLFTDVMTANRQLNNDNKDAVKQLLLLNPSHIAGLQGLWAELAIRTGIQKGALGMTNPTPRVTPNTNRWGNNGNHIDYVKFKAGRYEAERYAGISPFNFVFEEFVSNKKKPWEIFTQNRTINGVYHLRTARTTWFEKVRVDWNFLKLWAGAAPDTLDWETHGKDPVRLVKAHSLPNDRALQVLWGKTRGDLGLPPGGPQGQLDEAAIRKLQSGIPNIFGQNRNSATNSGNIKTLLRKIFSWELGVFAKDKKGDKSGEQDGQCVKRLPDGRLVKEDIEFKISIGLGETYPGEEVQLFKSFILNNLFLNCDYADTPPIRLIAKVESYFVAFGVAALSSKVLHKNIFEGPGRGISDPARARNLANLATSATAILKTPGIWRVTTITPGSSNANKTNAFPGCNFQAITTEVHRLRNEYERRLASFFEKMSGLRELRIVEDPYDLSEYVKSLVIADINDGTFKFSNSRKAYLRIASGLLNAFGDYLHGYKKTPFINRMKQGGLNAEGAAIAWRQLNGKWGTLIKEGRNRHRPIEHFTKGATRGILKGVTRQNAVNNKGETGDWLDSLKKFRFAILQQVRIATQPPTITEANNNDYMDFEEYIDAVFDEKEIKMIEAFMKVGEIPNSKYRRAGSKRPENSSNKAAYAVPEAFRGEGTNNSTVAATAVALGARVAARLPQNVENIIVGLPPAEQNNARRAALALGDPYVVRAILALPANQRQMAYAAAIRQGALQAPAPTSMNNNGAGGATW